MRIEEAISQLEDLKKDAQSHTSDDEPSSTFKRVYLKTMLRLYRQLAAYENTGFTPEQIEKLKKELHFTGKYWYICLPTK